VVADFGLVGRPIEEVVADPQAVDPARLGLAGERGDLRL